MKLKRARKKKTSIPKGQHSIYEVVPFKRRIKNMAVTHNNKYISYLKVTPKNLGNLNGTEQYQMMHQLETLERTYDYDHAILSLMFPPNVNENVLFWTKMLQEARQQKDISKVTTCKRQLEKLSMVKRFKPNQEFYIVVYADSVKEMLERKELLIRLGGNALGLKELSEEEFEQVQFKECNMNTEL